VPRAWGSRIDELAVVAAGGPHLRTETGLASGEPVAFVGLGRRGSDAGRPQGNCGPARPRSCAGVPWTKRRKRFIFLPTPWKPLISALSIIRCGLTKFVSPPQIKRQRWRQARDMKLSRRTLLRMATAFPAPLLPRVALAEDYPARPVRVVLGLAPGGSVDVVTRIVVQAMGEFLGQPFIVENKPGASGDIATEAVVRASPDGYTLLVVLAANAINATLHQKLRFDPVRDLTMVAGVVRVPNVLEVNPAVPANTVPEFVAYAKANPGKLSYASSGTGSSLHVIGELFKMMAGIDMVHVPYRGGAPAMIDLLGGRVQVMFDTIPQAVDYIADGKLRALAVTTATRSETLPDVPAISDFVPGFQAGSWWGLAAPKNTPHEIIHILSYAANAVLSDPAMKSRLAKLGTTPLLYGPGPFASFVEIEIDKWARVLKFSGTKED
jgi:tripartite-type tricarboxylate transporter receptor subunit TctC